MVSPEPFGHQFSALIASQFPCGSIYKCLKLVQQDARDADCAHSSVVQIYESKSALASHRVREASIKMRPCKQQYGSRFVSDPETQMTCTYGAAVLPDRGGQFQQPTLRIASADRAVNQHITNGTLVALFLSKLEADIRRRIKIHDGIHAFIQVGENLAPTKKTPSAL